MKHLKSPLNTYVYMTNQVVGAGEAIMGLNIVDIIKKALDSKTAKHISKWGVLNNIEITMCYDSKGNRIC